MIYSTDYFNLDRCVYRTSLQLKESQSLKWLLVKDMLLYLNDAIMMYKCIKQLAPDYLADANSCTTSHAQSQTPDPMRISVRHCLVVVYHGQMRPSFIVELNLSCLWNSLSYDVRTAKCPKVFKRRLINILLSSYAQFHAFHAFDSFTVFQLS